MRAILHIGGRRCENARKGFFRAFPVGVRARSERPLDSDAPSPPVPFFLKQPEGAGGTFPDGISKKAALRGASAD